MKYIIMCGGKYSAWDIPRQKTKIHGEAIVARTIRLLREAGVEDIVISTNLSGFEGYGVPIYKHDNNFNVTQQITKGYWVDAFYPIYEPVCYLMGDVVFSERAIEIIVNTEVDGIQFFASSPPFSNQYIKRWAEPFCFKVTDTERFQNAIARTKYLCDTGKFNRHPIAWELWQVICNTQINQIVYNNYISINDFTCDIDEPGDVAKIEEMIWQNI